MSSPSNFVDFLLQTSSNGSELLDSLPCAKVPSKRSVELFTPGHRLIMSDVLEAQQICSGCPVREMCLAWGWDNRESGVWGGTLLEKGAVRSIVNARKSSEADKKKVA